MTANLQGIVQRLGVKTSSILDWELGNSKGVVRGRAFVRADRVYSAGLEQVAVHVRRWDVEALRKHVSDKNFA
jgi:hypothetical protein